MPRAYCVQSNGLMIDLSRGDQNMARTGETKSISRLTDIGFPLYPGVTEQVSYTLLQNTTLSDSDTDNEEEMFSSDNNAARLEDSKLNELRGSRISKHNRSRHAPGNQQDATYDPCNNYLKEEIEPNKLLCQLSSNAFDIVGSEPNAQTQKSTVCLCIALRDKHGYIKRFVFHNGANLMSPAMRKKAQELGYDVIQAEQSHAELQFIQFLIRREEVRPGLYTHIMGMGCSRCYCAECDHVLKGLLKIATSVDDKKDISNGPKLGSMSAISKPINSSVADESGVVRYTQNKVQDVEYGVVKDEQAVDDAIYDHCYVPLSLQGLFNHTTGVAHDYSGNRITKSSPQRKARRRDQH